MTKTTTKSGKAVKITVRNVGQCFACCSEIKAGRKVLWQSRDYPYGFDSVAREAAEAKLAEL